MIKGGFQFHPVGHGLFYSGKISSANHINFVFDCGKSRYKKNSQEIIEDCINNYLRRSHVQKLDMLFISHLHDDHINGIPKLLDGINCERVILPYFTPFQRLFLVAEYLSNQDGLDSQNPNDPNDGSNERDENNEVLKIIINPHSYFNERGINVVYVNGGKDNNERESKEDYGKGNEDDRDTQDENLEIDISETDNIDDIISIEGEDPNNKKTKNNSSVKLLDGNRIKLDRYWKFIVYNRKLDDSKIAEFKNKVNEEFKDLINENDNIKANGLNNIVSKKELKSKLLCIYNEIFTEGNINNYGLMLIHRPVLARHRFLELEFHESKSCYCDVDCFYDCNCYCRCRSRHYCSNRRYENMCCKPFSTLLTGDRGLRFLLDNDIPINDELLNVHIFQVPHHGSETGWVKENLNSISEYCKNKKAIICHSRRYNLPKINVIHDLQDNYFDIKLVNKIPFKYNIIRFGN